jgi:hypothetical protein
MSTTTLLIRKNQLAETRLATTDDTPLADGQVRVRVESFALTSNNITYAAFGEAMQLLAVLPGAGRRRDPGLGLHPGVGLRHRGAVAAPRRGGGRAAVRLLADGQPCGAAAGQTVGRQLQRRRAAPRALHAVYNQYQRCSSDPFYTADSESVQALLRPLFLTSWLIDDFLADNAFFGTTAGGARLMLLSSASSKRRTAPPPNWPSGKTWRWWASPRPAMWPSARAWAATAGC